MKKALSFSLCLLILAALPLRAAASGENWDRSLKNLEDSGILSPIDDLYRGAPFEDGYGWREILKDILTGKGIDFGKTARSLINNFAGDVFSHTKILGKIMLLGFCVACMEILTDTISPEGTAQTALWVSHMALVTLSILVFKDALKIAREAMELMRSGFLAFIPAITGLTLASGAPVSAGILHPLVFAMGGLVSVFVLDVAFPLIYTSVAVDLAGNLGGGNRVYGVAGLLRQAAFLGTGTLMSIFVGVVASQNAAAGVVDGAAFRTAKYVASTFVPVAGKAMSDTMELFFLSARGLRSAIGIAGSIALLSMVFTPLVKLLSCYLVWRLSFSFLGPLSGDGVAKSLKAMSDGISSLAMTLLVTGFVFVICLSLVAGATRPL